MKTLLISIAICSISIGFSQNFAPIGAVWHYGQAWMGPGSSFLKIESIQDSVFNNKNCTLLIKNEEVGCDGRPLEVLVYEEDSVVYFWDTKFDEFQILYDLKKQTGESWVFKTKSPITQVIDTLTVTVNSISSESINGFDLMKLFVTHSNSSGNQFSTSIYEKIGDPSYMFNYISDVNMACDVNYSSGLRCYEDADFGFYTTNSAIACDYNSLSLAKKRENDFTISPNPATDNIFIETKLNDFGNFKIQLINSLGEIVIEANSQNNIDVSSLSCGVYIFNLISNQNSFSEKIVIIK